MNIIFLLISSCIQYKVLSLSSGLSRFRVLITFFFFCVACSPLFFNFITSDGYRYYSVFRDLVETSPLEYNLFEGSISIINYYSTSKDGLAYISSFFAYVFQASSKTSYLSSLNTIAAIALVYIDKVLNPLQYNAFFRTSFLVLNPIFVYFQVRGLKESVAILSFMACYSWIVSNALITRVTSVSPRLLGIPTHSHFFLIFFLALLSIAKWQLAVFILFILITYSFSLIRKLRPSSLFSSIKKQPLVESLKLLLSVIIVRYLIVSIAENSSSKLVVTLLFNPQLLFEHSYQTFSIDSISSIQPFNVGGLLFNFAILASFLCSILVIFRLRRLHAFARFFPRVQCIIFYSRSFELLFSLSILSIPLIQFIVGSNEGIGNRIFIIPVAVMFLPFLFVDFMPLTIMRTDRILRYIRCR